jgi:hypothetical protein
VTTEFNAGAKEEEDRKRGLNQAGWFTSFFSDRETTPTERDRSMDEAYGFITNQTDSNGMFRDLD